MVPAVDFQGFFVALEEGLFKAQGLNVTFKPAISGATVIDQQAEGKIDVTEQQRLLRPAQSNWDAGIDEPVQPRHPRRQPGHLRRGIAAAAGSHGPVHHARLADTATCAQLKGRTVGNNAPKESHLHGGRLGAGRSPDIRRAACALFVVKGGFPQIQAELKTGAFNAAVLNEPFGSRRGAVRWRRDAGRLRPGRDRGRSRSGYVIERYDNEDTPHTLAAFYKALEQGQQIADANREAVEAAFENLPSPLGLPGRGGHGPGELSGRRETVGSVDTVQLEARGERHAAVHRVRPGLRHHQFDADGRLVTLRGETSLRGSFRLLNTMRGWSGGASR